MAKFEFVSWLVSFLSQSFFEFQWDSGNESKSEQEHGVFTHEIEEVFYDKNLVPLGIQIQPIVNEIRLALIGKTSTDKILFVCFTMRDLKIRVISSRKANKAEKELYEEEND